MQLFGCANHSQANYAPYTKLLRKYRHFHLISRPFMSDILGLETKTADIFGLYENGAMQILA